MRRSWPLASLRRAASCWYTAFFVPVVKHQRDRERPLRWGWAPNDRLVSLARAHGRHGDRENQGGSGRRKEDGARAARARCGTARLTTAARNGQTRATSLVRPPRHTHFAGAASNIAW